MSRRTRNRHRSEAGFEEPSLVPMADMLTNTVGVIVFILIFTVLAASGGELLKRLPREHQTEATPRYYICAGGKIYHLDEALVKSIRQRAEVESAGRSSDELVGKSWTGSDSSMDIVLRVRRVPLTIGSGPTRQIIRLSAEVVLKESGGESSTELMRPDSAFHRDLGSTSSTKDFVMIWLKPDSMGVMHTAREAAIKSGFEVGWSPWAQEAPIEFGFGSGSDVGPL